MARTESFRFEKNQENHVALACQYLCEMHDILDEFSHELFISIFKTKLQRLK